MRAFDREKFRLLHIQLRADSELGVLPSGESIVDADGNPGRLTIVGPAPDFLRIAIPVLEDPLATPEVPHDVFNAYLDLPNLGDGVYTVEMRYLDKRWEMMRYFEQQFYLVSGLTVLELEAAERTELEWLELDPNGFELRIPVAVPVPAPSVEPLELLLETVETVEVEFMLKEQGLDVKVRTEDSMELDASVAALDLEIDISAQEVFEVDASADEMMELSSELVESFLHLEGFTFGLTP